MHSNHPHLGVIEPMDARQRMTFNVDVNFLDSQEVLSIPAKSRHAAILLWLKVGCWSRRKNTDGHVSGDELRELEANPNLVRLLIRSTLWKLDPATPPDAVNRLQDATRRFAGVLVPSIIVANWQKWQITSGDIERTRAGDRKRQRRARNAAKTTVTGTDADASRRDNGVTANNGHGVTPTDQLTTSQRDTDARHGVTLSSSNREYSGKELTQVPQAVADALPFLDHCSEHRYTEHPPKCGACRETREQNERVANDRANVEAVKAVDARLRSKQRRADCWDCDDEGWMYGDDGLVMDPACRCTHPEVP